MSESKYKTGDRISLAKWDDTVTRRDQLGNATVIKVEKARSQSGWMVHFITDHGDPYQLDQDWIEPLLI